MPGDDNDTKNGDFDEPMSSEEMLRQARADLFEDEEITPDDSAHSPDDESLSAEQIAEALRSSSFDDDYGATGDLLSSDEIIAGADPAATRTVLPPPPTTLPGDIFARPGDDPYDPATRPATGDDRVGRSTPYPQPPGRSPAPTGNRVWIAAAIIVAVAAAGVAALFLASEDSTPVEDLVVGNCFNEPGDDLVFNVEQVPCSAEHDYEVFAVYREPSGPYPGDEAIFSSADAECITYFERYVGTPFEASEVWYTYFTPTSDGWSAGDREVTCMLFLLDDSSEIVPTTGSLRNSGR